MIFNSEICTKLNFNLPKQLNFYINRLSLFDLWSRRKLEIYHLVVPKRGKRGLHHVMVGLHFSLPKARLLPYGEETIGGSRKYIYVFGNF
jgi:hypothetical protein